jgi:hypothetical protein
MTPAQNDKVTIMFEDQVVDSVYVEYTTPHKNVEILSYQRQEYEERTKQCSDQYHRDLERIHSDAFVELVKRKSGVWNNVVRVEFNFGPRFLCYQGFDKDNNIMLTVLIPAFDIVGLRTYSNPTPNYQALRQTRKQTKRNMKLDRSELEALR